MPRPPKLENAQLKRSGTMRTSMEKRLQSAVERLLALNDAKALTIERLATEAGVSPSRIYAYPSVKQETVDAALASAQRAVDIVGVEHKEFRVRMATGFIALQQAMNNVVSRYHWFILILVNIAIAIISVFAYRSIVAAVLLLIPVNLSNYLLMAAMHVLGIGLDINAVIVAVMGVGIGIDYGIYLLSRICEEFTVQEGDWAKAITAAMTTTGKAIMFTASMMLIGIIPWYFLSDLKFIADMGMLLAAIMLINMALSLIVLPLLVWLIKPRFASRTDLALSENIDLSLFVTGHQQHRDSQ